MSRQPHVRPVYLPPAEPEPESLASLLLVGAALFMAFVFAFVLLPVMAS